MTAKIYLNVVDQEDGDSVLVMRGAGPLLVGDEFDESLACGSCKKVLAKHVSTRTLYNRFSAPKRLIIRCLCGAHNRVPSQVS